MRVSTLCPPKENYGLPCFREVATNLITIVTDSVDAMLDPILGTFNGPLTTTIGGQAVTAYLSGSAEMVAWGNANLAGGAQLPFEGPPIQEAIDYARQQGAKIVTGIDDQTKRRLAQVISDGIKNKRGIPGLTRDIRDMFDSMATNRANLIARTECLPGETLVDGAVIWAIHRRWYDGPMVEIVTSGGRKFSATPNHPMFTGRGWLPAGEITESDYLVCDSGQQDSGSSSDQDVEAPPTTLRKIFDTASAISVRKRERGTYPDFHGDGQETEVDVLYPDRLLTIGSFAPIYEPTLKQFLSPSDMIRAPICLGCGRLLSITNPSCFCVPANGDIGLPQPGQYQTRAHAERRCYRSGRFPVEVAIYNHVGGDSVAVARAPDTPSEHIAPALCDGSHHSSIVQNLTNPFPVLPHVRCNLVPGAPPKIELDRVISVCIRTFSAHVFNLTTPYGYYTIDQAFTGNTSEALSQAFLDRSNDMGVTGKESIPIEPVDADCLRNAAAGPIPIKQPFPSGHPRPPFHPNCVCSLAPVMI